MEFCWNWGRGPSFFKINILTDCMHARLIWKCAAQCDFRQCLTFGQGCITQVGICDHAHAHKLAPSAIVNELVHDCMVVSKRSSSDWVRLGPMHARGKTWTLLYFSHRIAPTDKIINPLGQFSRNESAWQLRIIISVISCTVVWKQPLLVFAVLPEPDGLSSSDRTRSDMFFVFHW